MEMKSSIDSISPIGVKATISHTESEATAAEMSWIDDMDAPPGCGYDEQQRYESNNASSRNPHNIWSLLGKPNL